MRADTEKDLKALRLYANNNRCKGDGSFKSQVAQDIMGLIIAICDHHEGEDQEQHAVSKLNAALGRTDE